MATDPQGWVPLVGKGRDDELEDFEKQALGGVARTYLDIVERSPPQGFGVTIDNVEAKHAEALSNWEVAMAIKLQRRRDLMIAFIQGQG
jgi:hypothetical protein